MIQVNQPGMDKNWPGDQLRKALRKLFYTHPEKILFSRLVVYQTGPNLLSQFSETHWPIVFLFAAHVRKSHPVFF